MQNAKCRTQSAVVAGAIVAITGIWLVAFDPPQQTAGDGLTQITQPDGLHAEVNFIDAGILFAGQRETICYPLSRFELDDSHIKSVKSSCDCVTAEIIDYQSGSADATSQALMLHLNGMEGPGTGEAPMILGVQIQIDLDSGDWRRIEVSLTLASRIGKEETR